MKKLLLLVTTCLLIPLSSCGEQNKTIKIFISSNEEVNINSIKEAYSSYDLEISYSNPTSNYYSFLYKTAREKDYDIFIIRDNEYIESNIKNIFIPFDENNISYLGNKTYDFYRIEDINYGIKLTSGDYQINNYVSFEEGHEYYLSLAKFSRNVGRYSSYSTESYSALEFLNNLL